MSRLYLDNIIFSLQKAGGISAVWEQLIASAVEQSGVDVRFIEYPEADKNIFRNKIQIPAEKILQKGVSSRNARFFPEFIQEKEPFLFHSSYYRYSPGSKACNITTVHDFTYERFVGGLKKHIHVLQKYAAIRRSEAIVCVSENTKRDLLHYLPEIAPKKIRVIYNGVSEVFRPLVCPRQDMSDYVLFVGSRAAYKNFDFLVESLTGSSFRLAIVGAPVTEDEKNKLDHLLGQEGWKAFSHISDEALNELYNSVYCLAYPSSYEGFGIPVLEAQRAGCPVIALRASSIPEVIGETPLMLDNLSIEAFKKKLGWLNSETVREEVMRSGFENAARFSWGKMTRQYVELYQELGDGLS